MEFKEMSEIEEYYYYKNRIEHIKYTLTNLGYKYDEPHGWYDYYRRPHSATQQKAIKENIEFFKEAVKRVNELKKKYKF